MLVGGAGVDTFNVTSGTDTIADLGAGGNDILVVSAGATANATAVGAWTAAASSSNAATGTAIVAASNFNISVAGAAGAGGWTLTNAGNGIGVTLTGSANADTLIGGTAGDTLVGNIGADILTGGAGGDTLQGGTGGDSYLFGLTDGTDVINELGSGSAGDSITITGAGALSSLNFFDSSTTAAAGDLVINFAGQQITVSNQYQSASAIESLTFSGGMTFSGYALNGTFILSIDDNASGPGAFDGTSSADIVSGDALPENVRGLAGADLLFGNVSADMLNGGLDADLLVGGLGSDSFVFAAGDSGQTSGTIDVIADYTKGAVGTGDEIDHGSSMVIGGSNASATATQASVSATTGVATFAAGSGTTLADALGDVAARFTAAADAAGEFALFQIGGVGDYYTFISDGAAGVGANDIVVRLFNVTTIGTINLTGGDLTILT